MHESGGRQAGKAGLPHLILWEPAAQELHAQVLPARWSSGSEGRGFVVSHKKAGHGGGCGGSGGGGDGGRRGGTVRRARRRMTTPDDEPPLIISLPIPPPPQTRPGRSRPTPSP